MTNQTNRIHLRYAQYPLTKTKILQCIYKKKNETIQYPFLKVCSPLVVFSYDNFNSSFPAFPVCGLQKKEGDGK